MALPRCERLESKKDYVMLAEIEAFFFAANGYAMGVPPMRQLMLLTAVATLVWKSDGSGM